MSVVMTCLCSSSSMVCCSPMIPSSELTTPSWWCTRRRSCWRCSSTWPAPPRCRDWWYHRTFTTSSRGFNFAVFPETLEVDGIRRLSGSTRGLTSLPSPHPCLRCLPITSLLRGPGLVSSPLITYPWGESHTPLLAADPCVTGRVTLLCSPATRWCQDLGHEPPARGRPGHLPPPTWASIRD